MKDNYVILTILLVLAPLAMPAPSPVPVAQALTASAAPDPGAASADLPKAPPLFIENAGQWDPGARFHVRGALGGGLWLAEEAIWLTLPEPLPAGAEFRPWRAVNLKLTFDGANAHPQLVPFAPLDTTVNYYLGDDPGRWQERVPTWGGVRYQELYPGLDLVLAARGGQWTWWFDVTAAWADLSAVRLRVEGADAVDVAGGRLEMAAAGRPATLALPALEGVPRGTGPAVESATGGTFTVSGPFSWSSPVDSSTALDDDPSLLSFSTYVGGSGCDNRGFSLALDGAGQAVVTGWTTSAEFPTTPGAYDVSHSGKTDIFVLKLAADGSSLLFSTFVGGGGYESGQSLALDGAGQAVVTGSTSSSNFPTTPGAYDTSYNGGSIYTPSDSFVFKLAADGGSLLFSTFVGGSSDESSRSLALDGAGQAVITGVTDSSDFPTTPGAYDTSFNGDDDVFVLKLAADGGSLLYSTFVGGSANEQGSAVALDGAGQAVVTGWTNSADFPTTPGAYDTSHNIHYDVFVMKLAADGGSLVYSTFVGGSYADMGNALALDGDGQAFVTGYTASEGFPTTYTADCSVSNVFVLKLSAAGDSLLYSTCVGGIGHSGDGESGRSLALNSAGQVVVTGYTNHELFPTTPGAYDTSFNGDDDVFVLKLAAGGSSLLYSTYVGGSGNEGGSSLALGGTREAVVTGYTGSYNFPTTAGAYDASFNGYYDVFVLKLAFPLAAPVLSNISNPDGDGDYLVDWNEVTEAISYTLQEDDNSSFPSPVTLYEGPNTQFQVTGQEAGRWYYRVRATDADGDSSWSTYEYVVVMDAPVLSPISNPDGDGDYLVDWNEVTGATSYALQEDDDSSFYSVVARYYPASAQYSVTGQHAGTWYYRVRGWRAGGSGPWSDTESVVVNEPPPEEPVLSPIYNYDGDGDYLLDWSEVTEAISYTLQEDDNSVFSSPLTHYEGASRMYHINNQPAGAWYYRVQASNANGNSPWSNTESVTVSEPSLVAPVLSSISNPDGDGDYLLDWSEVTDANSYTLQEDGDLSFSSPLTRYEGADSQFQVTGQGVGTWYYRVRGSNDGGDSPWSNVESAAVEEPPLEAPVLEPISNPDGDGDYLVDWSDVAGATSYTLQEDEHAGFYSPITCYSGAGSQYQVTGQGAGTWYYRVQASSAAGDSPWSEVQGVTLEQGWVYLPLVVKSQ